MTANLRAASIAGFLVAALAAEFALTSAVLDRHVASRAAEDLQRLARRESPFRWEFDSEAEVKKGRCRGLSDLVFRDGLLEALAADSDPFITLEQDQRFADARLHARFLARIRSDRSARFQLHHVPRGGGAILESPLFPLDPGWQEVSLNLAAIEWRSLRFDTAGGPAPVSAEPARWGGETGAIEAIRIDPVCETDVAFAIDWVRLDGVVAERVPDLAAPIERIDLAFDPGPARFPVVTLSLAAAASAEAREGLRRRAADPPIVELTGAFRTPERVLAAMDAIRAAAPAAVIFPRRIVPADVEPVGPERLRAAFAFARDDRSARRDVLRASAVAAATIVPLYLWLRRRAPRRARAAADVGLLVAMAGVLLGCVRRFDESPAPAVLGAAIVALGLTCALSDGAFPSGAVRSLGLGLGSARAWREAGLATVVPLLAIVAIGVASEEEASFGARLRPAAAYAGWALAQQFLLGPVVVRRLLALSNGRSAPSALGGALIFSLLHFPNFSLMAATLVMGSVWAAIFVRRGTIVPIAASHASLGTAFGLLAPEALRRSGQVGLRFFG